MSNVEFLPGEFLNGDQYLARQIGSMALQHRDLGSGFPWEQTKESWKDILTRIGEPLLAYADGKDVEDPGRTDFKKLNDDAKEAMKLFAEWFTAFWD